MLMGYWAEHGAAPLLPGVSDPMVQSAAVNSAIASAAHIAAGQALGLTYGSYQNHAANSIADFMLTENGGTSGPEIAAGVAAWSQYVGVGVKTAVYDEVQFYAGSFTYADYKAELNANRPVLLNLVTYVSGQDYVGHSVLGYGYRDDMFNIRLRTGPASYLDVTVPGFAVMDTWKNGVGAGKQSEWTDWAGNPLYALLDGNGVEWWPFLDLTLAHGYDYATLWDWEVFSGVFYQPVPVPPTLVLLGSGLLCLWRPRRLRPK